MMLTDKKHGISWAYNTAYNTSILQSYNSIIPDMPTVIVSENSDCMI